MYIGYIPTEHESVIYTILYSLFSTIHLWTHSINSYISPGRYVSLLINTLNKPWWHEGKCTADPRGGAGPGPFPPLMSIYGPS